MKYIVCKKAKAKKYKFNTENHVIIGDQIVLNEKEVRCSMELLSAETLEGKAEILDGTIYASSTELLNLINQ